MPESGARSNTEQVAERVVAELTESNEHADGGEQVDLTREVWQTRVPLNRRRFVRGRRASHRGCDIGPRQLQPVTGVHADRLVGVSGAMESGEEPVARAVTREDTTGAIPAMRRGCETDDQQLSVGITEPGDGTGPVLLIPKRCPLLACDPLPPVDEPGAEATLGDLVRESR